MSDLDSGSATRVMKTPDTAFTSETYENQCRSCKEERKKRNEQPT